MKLDTAEVIALAKQTAEYHRQLGVEDVPPTLALMMTQKFIDAMVNEIAFTKRQAAHEKPEWEKGAGT